MPKILLNNKYLSSPSRYPRLRTGFIPPFAQALLLFSAIGVLILVCLTQCRGKGGFDAPVIFSKGSLPDFTEIENVSERKARFFSYLLPYVREANEQILKDREYLLNLIQKHGQVETLSSRELAWAERMVRDHFPNETFDEVTMSDLKRLVPKIDIIPPSLALAQAAVESGWGTSRFAQQGNNLFGMWCYEPGCGMVPRQRPVGETYEVESYRSPKESFYDYIDNLNTNSAYAPLRSIRVKLRDTGDSIDGITLANGLIRYSQEGWIYVDKIQSIIRSNNLMQYDSE